MTTEDRAQRLRTLWREWRQHIWRRIQETGSATVPDRLDTDPIDLPPAPSMPEAVRTGSDTVTFTLDRRGRVTTVAAEGITVEARTL